MTASDLPKLANSHAVAKPPVAAIRIDGCIMSSEAIVRLAHENGAMGCTFDRTKHYDRWGRTTLEYLADHGYRVEKHLGNGRWARIQKMTEQEIKALGCAAALLA